ncbi:LytR C-terminal domain-containing protein [Candidatus Latescibacterota bacterium]
MTIIVISLISIIILYHSLRSTDLHVEKRNSTNIRIAVLNGCGREGLATLFSGNLRNLGYDVVNGQGGNADSFDFDFSVVLNRKGNRKNAEKVANDLGIKEIIDQYSTNLYIIEDIVVILGRDWDTLKISKEVLFD